jgi:hypothetical protein
MEDQQLQKLIEEFCQETHGSSNYNQETLFLAGVEPGQFVPINYLKKKTKNLELESQLVEQGYIYGNYEFWEKSDFREWYEQQFGHKLPIKATKTINFLYKNNTDLILHSIDKIHEIYLQLNDQKIIINSKNFPIQLGEWYVKSIFGLKQVKSTAQKGFDFLMDGDAVEIKVNWKIHSSERPSPKGLKIKKSLVGLAQSCIFIFLSQDFRIKDLCLLQSDFLLKRFPTKGHTLFIKELEIAPFLLSRSDKYLVKLKNKKTLLLFSSPQLKQKLLNRI